MTKEEFDNYRFSIVTEVNWFEDRWDKVRSVFFDSQAIEVEGGTIIHFSKVKGIRESNA